MVPKSDLKKIPISKPFLFSGCVDFSPLLANNHGLLQTSN